MKKVFPVCMMLTAVFSGAFAQDSFYQILSDSAFLLTRDRVLYDPAYFRISYPNGDVPADRGVCTDVVIRAYRKVGIDLQREVHEDMLANFSVYPNNWRATAPDRNIDHRRVPNLMTFFKRKGVVKPITQNPEDYMPGDIVCWNLGGGTNHIGIVVNQRSDDDACYMIIHNIGWGQVVEDRLFAWKIIGHYQFKK